MAHFLFSCDLAGEITLRNGVAYFNNNDVLGASIGGITASFIKCYDKRQILMV